MDPSGIDFILGHHQIS